MNGAGMQKRGWLVFFFALLGAICVAAPVLAETPAEEEGETAPPLQLQRDESLETPQAVAARESTEFAFADLTASEEASLLEERFAEQLQAIDADPARALADIVIERIDSPTEALVTLDGEKVLLESEVPLRAPEEDGGLHKVELGLEETAAGYEPTNPLVDLTLPDSAQDPIVIGDEGLTITPAGTAATAATPIGDEDLLLAGSHEDTSLLLSPIAGGLELSAMLASRNSPQQLAFDVALPQGASLLASESGGAEVVDAGGELIATITAPHAVDAQGTEVPAALSVEGASLSILVPHRELDVAYPLFVDPEIIEDWSGFADTSKLGYWKWAWGGVAGGEDYIGKTSCIVTCWGNGLYVRARSGFTYPAGSWGRWWFTPQGSTTYMKRVIFGPIHFDAHGCWGNEPHAYVGVWNDYSGWVVLGNMYPTGGMTGVDVGLPVGSRTAFVGFHSSSTATPSCGRDYHFGGATLFLDDAENPTVYPTYGYPTGWVKNGASFTISAPASDPGLGMKKATLSPKQTVYQKQELGCNGHYSNPCPANHIFQFPMGAGSFDEGEKGVQFSVEDALGKPSTTYAWNMKVDRTPPEIELAGQLAQATDETEGDGKDDKDKPLPLPVYNLTVNTTDGVLNPVDGGQKRSGVKKIQVFIDNRPTPEQTWEASSCPAGNCPLSKVFVLKLNELSADSEHYLRVLATDFAGNAPRERKLEFEYIPATGMKDEYVMQYFPLPDGSGNEAEEEHPSRPELAVNLVSGNLVYRQEDLDVSGAAADLELELFYNSLLPEQQNTEWGDGWTLSQTPELEIEDPGAPGPPSEATIVDESAMVESKVDLPAAVGEEEFDKRLQATVEKVAGGYELTDESGETGETVTFDSSGKADELTNGTAATVDYAYEEGDLAAITIEDPGTANADPESIDEGEPSPSLVVSHSANFGSSGSADGQLKTPADVVAGPEGNIWILDRGNSRVQRFGPDGQFISKFGSAGSGEGQLSSPTAIALDGAGNVLVTENGRVQKFSPSGQSLLKFGSVGYGENEFFLTRGITVGADGSIWIGDYQGVKRFTPQGQFIERVGASGTGQLSSAQSLATAPSGDVYVADSNASRIKVYDEDGDFLRGFGSAGTAPGQFSNATEVDIDDEGNVWVGEELGDRIQVFTEAGDYIATFGAPGSGAQQLALSEHTGIAVALGRVWIADAGNERVSRWLSERTTGFLHSANFGASGSADGQMNTPADVAVSDQGDLWILDRGNSRVQRFGTDGQFVSKFGSGEGQLSSPTAIALDGAGNVLVTENGRVQKFSPSGQSLLKFGSVGYGENEFFLTRGITVGADGSIWIGDYQGVKRFTPQGQFIERVGASGTGQLSSAQSLATAPSGDVYVADSNASRIKVYDEDGDFLRGFGSAGTAPGQFSNATEVDIDDEGNVWVGEELGDRVQVFTEAGDYIATFGAPGSGVQQLALSEHTGLAAASGRVWVADAGNNRLDEWLGGNYEPSNEPVLTEDDPQLEVDVSGGLVDTVEGEESGTIDYDHSGDLLTAVDAPDGEAQFSYDSAGRMTKVSLPNGTYGEIVYEATYGRVKSVKVVVEGGSPKTTYFSWSDEPRRTTVTPPDAPATTYDIAADGSIFKWWNAKQPPVFDDLAGSLYVSRETSAPIATGAHNLVIQAHDEEGVASIQVIANGNQLVDERTCTYDPEKPTECLTETNEWVTETGNWPPGIVYLEVIATDRLGESSSERFWVNIPYTPPPDPEAEEPPRFGDILRFREDRGLDLDLDSDELVINDRVFESMGDWNNPLTPAGEVARATDARWGVPLRAVDAAELEHRHTYSTQAISAIPKWASANAGSSYAGYFIDERSGGLLRVGFTGGSANQTNLIEALRQSGGLIAPDRVRGFSSPPSHSLAALNALQGQINGLRASSPNLITKVSVDVQENRVAVGASDVGQAKYLLDQSFGVSAPIAVTFQLPMPKRSGRERAAGPMRAGDWMILQDNPKGQVPEAQQEKGLACTANFGAFDRFKSPQTGTDTYAMFVLGAGHCLFETGHEVMRRGDPTAQEKDWFGWIRREGNDGKPNTIDVDAAAVRIKDPGIVPRKIFTSEKRERVPVIGIAEAPGIGTEVCYSGINSRRERCGPILDKPHIEYEAFGGTGTTVAVCFEEYIRGGDSGSPVWLQTPGGALAVGIANQGFDEEEAITAGAPKEACFEPLVPYPGWGPESGVLTNPGLAPLQLAKAP
jgi:YD repeat-containing protein